MNGILGLILGLAVAPPSSSHPVVSPTGRRIAFVSDRGGVSQVYLINPDGTGTGKVWNAHWSPDGSLIVYTGGRAAPATGLAIFLVRPDGSARRELFAAPPGDGNAQMPSWSPDGRSLAVQVSGERLGHIWTVDATTFPTASGSYFRAPGRDRWKSGR